MAPHGPTLTNKAPAKLIGFDKLKNVYPKISKIIVTPKYHTNHHTVAELSRNANYASIFTVWDYLFFTYKNATVTEREYLGVEDRSKEFGFIDNIKYPLRKL